MSTMDQNGGLIASAPPAKRQAYPIPGGNGHETTLATPEERLKHIQNAQMKVLSDRDTYVGMQWNPVNDTPLGIGTQPDSYCPELDQYGDDAAMNAARFLPKNVRNRIVKYLEDGTLRPGELDLKCVVVMQSLSPELLLKVMDHLDADRAFFLNAHSKAGFIISTCDKAKRGELDVRGFGAIDPWRGHMRDLCIRRPLGVDLLSEDDWITRKGETLSLQIIQRIPAAIRHKGQVSPNNIVIDDLSMRMTIGQLKAMLEDKAQGWKPGVMKLIVRETGVLNDNSKTIAYYNLSSGDRIRLKLKKRGGIRINKCNRVKETKKSHAEEGDDDDQVEEKKETIQNDVQQQQANGVMAPSPPPPPSE
ncbi:hypothetical protein Pmar_PMAR007235 [Perkinsus marinus ATCC 50983]|uniref:Ubiquitin-like domain-containing protein n=1 Tax=Perkinsus marinus (strain ATCC 50983 / TXsc) TaxID=423536 RepID=C5LWR1_PERM5|nr:hypothetical protein Pmar_PMAR007235 [Perkinsus marinus ATCC 50983]EEQ98856.1 hypothetical protein Pmar_PMAR007235 [Perkinsus marinus ATCC 50983]|eukprot:XP_002766139.1 hypothetical protein Pmar_PMAR007235 [Perkinsus marinus ATCC 50983]